METLNLGVNEKFIKLINEAGQADNNKLQSLRREFIMALNNIGPKKFVMIMSDIFKNNFCIEGCNDIRMPLKRIFNISLRELEEALLDKKRTLPKEHPISLLSEDHKDNVVKLKALNLSLSKIRLNMVKDYYSELDTHIRKEEEVLFPALEKNGMQEHPQNLREEHKGFREILTKIIDFLKDANSERNDLTVKGIEKSKDKFISDISNHIFRETFIFYPAALEYIDDTREWENIKKKFDSISV